MRTDEEIDAIMGLHYALSQERVLERIDNLSDTITAVLTKGRDSMTTQQETIDAFIIACSTDAYRLAASTQTKREIPVLTSPALGLPGPPSPTPTTSPTDEAAAAIADSRRNVPQPIPESTGPRFGHPHRERAMKVVYLDRAQVGYIKSLPRLGSTIPGSDRTGIVLHHTAGGRLVSRSQEQALVYVRRLQTGVRRKTSWCADVPYNFPTSLIHSEDGEWSVLIAEGRGWNRRGAHTVDKIVDADPIEDENRELISFGFQSDWRKYRKILQQHTADPDAIVDEMVASVGEWARDTADQIIPAHQIRYFFGHRDFKTTPCPSTVLYNSLDLLEAAFNGGGSSQRGGDHPMCRICEELSAPELDLLIAAAKAEAKPVDEGGFGLRATSRGHTVNLLRALADVSEISPMDQHGLANWIAGADVSKSQAV